MVRYLCAALAMAALCANASDWRLAGHIGGEAKDDSYSFYDAESLSRPTKDAVRVWIIKSADLDRFSKANNRLIIHKAAQKVAGGYSPQFLQIPSVRSKYSAEELRDAIAMGTLDEVMANEPDSPITTKLYFEIDCAEKRSKTLDGILYTNKGTPAYGKYHGDGSYSYIAPDSNSEWLAMMVCPR